MWVLIIVFSIHNMYGSLAATSQQVEFKTETACANASDGIAKAFPTATTFCLKK